jgi:hypothetical protein
VSKCLNGPGGEPLRQLDTVPAAKREADRIVNKNLQVPGGTWRYFCHAAYETIVMADITE